MNTRPSNAVSTHCRRESVTATVDSPATTYVVECYWPDISEHQAEAALAGIAYCRSGWAPPTACGLWAASWVPSDGLASFLIAGPSAGVIRAVGEAVQLAVRSDRRIDLDRGCDDSHRVSSGSQTKEHDMRKIFTAIGLSAVLTTAAAMLPVSALAGQPVTQTLTPPPPAFEVCKAIGSGTLCQGSRVLVEPLFDTGIVCGSGAGAFDIQYGDTINQVASRTYNLDGNLTETLHRGALHGSRLCKPSHGRIPARHGPRRHLRRPGRPRRWKLGHRDHNRPVHHHPARHGRVAPERRSSRAARSGRFHRVHRRPTEFLDLINGDPTVTQKLCTAVGG